jgi:ABC-type uncharacterized transport system ATPase subunit
MWIELQDIHKNYGTVKANDGISLSFEPGIIHGILGENGSGKSTLMKILAGFTRKTSGKILLDKVPGNYKSPTGALGHGIGMLYQDPLDYPALSVINNFKLGQACGKLFHSKKINETFERFAEAFNFKLHPDTPVRILTVGERQQLEIIRLIAIGVKVLILDEPTTGITDRQKRKLFVALKKLASEGKSIILVSHCMEDIEELCSRVTVLRQGTVSGEAKAPFDTNNLLKMMFGVSPRKPSRLDKNPGKVILEMKGVSASGGRTGLKKLDCVINQGEITGLAGLEGSGQDVFLRVAAGLSQPLEGTIKLNGIKMNGRSLNTFIKAGAVFQPASRLEEGLIPGLNIMEHNMLRDKHLPFFIRRKEALGKAGNNIQKYHIKGTPLSMVESLSGGNQQRLLLSLIPKVSNLLLLENPTRGLDMESVNWVWQSLQKYCDRKAGIAFSSPEIDEIFMVADRIIVFFNGRIILDKRIGLTDLNEVSRAIAGMTD